MSGSPGYAQSYETVFLDIDGTLLWVDLDVEGYVADLAPYSRGGALTVERAEAPVWKSVRRHIDGNINYRTPDELAAFKRENALRVARELEAEAPDELLEEISDRRISFNPYPESEKVLAGLRERGKKVYAVSNWDITLTETLAELGWLGYFDAVIASAELGIEKPDSGIFEEALRVAGESESRERVVHVGNDTVSDVAGAASCGIDAVLVSRHGESAEEAKAVVSDLTELFELPGLAGGING
ncbi:HAD family hydrolase [Rubrobacter aplysinae]|uniref:HAD family hydrolase n=1 Tax=Rubrobacter aplysinae TaxID=909625 RepID=UPI00069DE8D5|nr:HAD-IA family hydrolase [Rubrobacter aplysinae]